MSMMMPPGIGAPGMDQGPPPAEGPPLSSPEDGSNLDYLRTAIEAVKSYAEQEDDDQNLALAMKLLSGLQQILANEAKLGETAMGISPQAKYLAKQSGPR